MLFICVLYLFSVSFLQASESLSIEIPSEELSTNYNALARSVNSIVFDDASTAFVRPLQRRLSEISNSDPDTFEMIAFYATYKTLECEQKRNYIKVSRTADVLESRKKLKHVTSSVVSEEFRRTEIQKYIAMSLGFCSTLAVGVGATLITFYTKDPYSPMNSTL